MEQDAPVTLITGAGSGIGRALALQLAEAGHRLVLVGRTGSKLDSTATLAEAINPEGEIRCIEADISSSSEVQRVLDQVHHEHGGIDTLVNCAGIAPLVDLHEHDDQLLRDTFATNVFGPANMILGVLPEMKRRGSGCIINISSMASLDPFPGFFAYAASKAALDSLTRSLHKETAEHGIRAFTLNPGAVETPLLRSIISEQDYPSDRTIDPMEIATEIVDCIEGARDHQAGQVIEIPSG